MNWYALSQARIDDMQREVDRVRLARAAAVAHRPFRQALGSHVLALGLSIVGSRQATTPDGCGRTTLDDGRIVLVCGA